MPYGLDYYDNGNGGNDKSKIDTVWDHIFEYSLAVIAQCAQTRQKELNIIGLGSLQKAETYLDYDHEQD